MKKLLLSLTVVCLTFLSATAQVDIDKTINLTGTGPDGKVTGIKEVTAARDAVSAEVLQKGNLQFATTGASTATAYAVTLAPAVTGYTTGMMLSFIATVANTGPLTVNVNGLGARTIKKYATANLSSGDITVGQLVTVIYDGANFQLLSKENAQSPSRLATLVYTSDGF